MASPQELATDLADVSELLSAQVDAGLDRDEVLHSLYNSWAHRLSSATRIAPKGKTLVTQAIQSGPWNPNQKKDLASILLSSPDTGSTAAGRRAMQKLGFPENFIKLDTMVKLRDSKFSRASRMSLLAAEVRAIGIENADEKSLFQLVKLLAYCERNFDFSQELVWQCMTDLQNFIKSVPRVKGLPYLEHYPASADLLPSAIKDNAYPDGVLPVTVDMAEMATVLGSAKMRGRLHCITSDKAPKWLRNIPEEHRSAVMAAIKKGAPPISSPALPPSGSNQTPAPIADTFRFTNPPVIVPTTKVKHEPNDEDDNDEVDEDDDDDGDDDIADPNTIDDFERTFLAARSGVRAKHKGDLKKRPAASEDATAKGRPAAAVDVMKRPATSVAVMKRPSAAKKPASGLVKSLIVKNKSWKNVHSKIWHDTRNKVLKKTGDPAKAKAAACKAAADAKYKFLNGTLKY